MPKKIRHSKSKYATQMLSDPTHESEFFTLNWWESNAHRFPEELRRLTNLFINSNDFNLTSKYWLHLMKKNYEMLLDHGIEHFATTVSRNYFTWTEFTQAQIENLNDDAIQEKFHIDIFKRHYGFSAEESYKHNILIALLYRSTMNLPTMRNALEKISDEGFLYGKAPHLIHNGTILTLDKLSSISEIVTFEKVASSCEIVCEIGGGSGRTTDALLQMFPRIKMIYCDIPPASYIALTRLKTVFPDKKILIVDNVTDLSELFKSNKHWDIAIIPPVLLDGIPDRSLDLLIAIDCLHEFSNVNRAKIANIIERTAKTFYTKNWTDTIIPFDNIPLSSNHLNGYYFPDHWEVLHFGTSLFPGNFTEILFKIPETSHSL